MQTQGNAKGQKGEEETLTHTQGDPLLYTQGDSHTQEDPLTDSDRCRLGALLPRALFRGRYPSQIVLPMAPRSICT